jgi:hypothetical protein
MKNCFLQLYRLGDHARRQPGGIPGLCSPLVDRSRLFLPLPLVKVQAVAMSLPALTIMDAVTDIQSLILYPYMPPPPHT